MKRITSLLCAIIFITITSCSNEPETKKEVIVVPEQKAEPKPAPVKEEPKPTSVTIDKEGVEVQSKKVNVKVKPNQ